MAYVSTYEGFEIHRAGWSFYALHCTRDVTLEAEDDYGDMCRMIDRWNDDEAADAEWEREHARAVAAGRRLDATLSAVSAEINQIGAGK